MSNVRDLFVGIKIKDEVTANLRRIDTLVSGIAQNFQHLGGNMRGTLNISGALTAEVQRLSLRLSASEQNATDLRSTVSRLEIEMQQARQETQNLAQRLARAEQEARDLRDELNRVNGQIQNSNKSAVDLKGTIAGVASAVAGLAFGGTIISQALEMDEAFGRLQAQTGLMGSDLAGLKDAARDTFIRGYGENLNEVSDAVARVKQNMHGITGDEIGNVASKAMLMAQTFDSDVNEVTRGTNNMMQAFGIEAEKAFDLFTTGGARGLNFSNEMFDNVAEYAPLFGNMGYTAEEYFGIMERGAKAGVYNLIFWALMWRHIIETSLIAGKSLVDNQQPRLVMSKVQRLVERRRAQARSKWEGSLVEFDIV